MARNSSFSPSPSHPAAGWAASVEVTLALHLIYRSVRSASCFPLFLLSHFICAALARDVKSHVWLNNKCGLF